MYHCRSPNRGADRPLVEAFIAVSADMRLETMDRRAPLVLDPMSLIILTGRCNDCRVDKCTGPHPDCLGFELARDRVEQRFLHEGQGFGESERKGALCRRL